MSVPSDAGVCRFCGSVLLVEKMREVDLGGGVEHVCPDCDAEEAG